MVKICGKYELVKNENYQEYLTSLGVPKEKVQVDVDDKPILNIKLEGKNLTVNSQSKNPHTSNLVLDETVDETYGKMTFKSTAKLDGDALLVTSVTSDGKIHQRSFKFSDSEVVVTLSLQKSDAPVAKRYYKRL